MRSKPQFRCEGQTDINREMLMKNLKGMFAKPVKL